MKNSKQLPVRGMVILMLAVANAIVLRNGFTESDKWYWALLFTAPLLATTLIHGPIKKQRQVVTNKLHSKSNKNYATDKKQIAAYKR
jgi:hypothetical protein